MKGKQGIYFILMPSSLSSAQIKELLAEQSHSHVKVGDFNALLDTLAELYLLPNLESIQQTNNYSKNLRQAALSLKDAFWLKSIAVDEAAVLRELDQTLAHCYNQLSLDVELSETNFRLNSNVNIRLSAYFSDLCKLAKKMQFIRPDSQFLSQQWLAVADESSVETLTLITPKKSNLYVWQQEVVNKLQASLTKGEQALNLQQLLDDAFTVESQKSELQAISNALFHAELAEPIFQGDALNILSCRDPLEESEVLVSRIQQALKSGCKAQDITVVLPKGSVYQQILPGLFDQAGIPSSNLGNTQECLEWHIQLIKDLITLYASQVNPDDHLQPVQLASVLVNPLMPWSLKFGQHLFERYQDSGNFNFINNENQSEELPTLLRLLLSGGDNIFIIWLNEITALLNYSQVIGVNAISVEACLEQVADLVITYSDLPSHEACFLIAKQLQPQRFSLNTGEDHWLLNSVLIVHEQNLLISPIQHLFILGFNEGCYEQNLKAKGIFQKSDWQTIAQKTGLNVYATLQQDVAFEQRFSRYFQVTQQSVQISLSEQSFDGSALQVSQTLVDLALVFQPLDNIEPQHLITPIKTLPSFVFLQYEYCKNTNMPVEELHIPADLILETDLIAVHNDKEGNPRTESPSSLDKMLVSPLAWLLDRQGLNPKGWAIQELSVSLMGTIAHKVFELHFEPSVSVSLDGYDALFDQAVFDEAPFLNIPKWRMERKQLKEETLAALVLFTQWCEDEGWKNHMQEGRLTGELFGLPIKGFVDAVFKKGASTLIIDYKKSASKKFVKRLNSGFELQTMMYRKLIDQQEGGLKNMHSGYFTLNDKTLVLDEVTPCSVRGLKQVNIQGTIQAQSAEAEAMLCKRIAQLKQGLVKLNYEDHQTRWEERGITTQYSVNGNALVANLLKPVESELEA